MAKTLFERFRAWELFSKARIEDEEECYIPDTHSRSTVLPSLTKPVVVEETQFFESHLKCDCEKDPQFSFACKNAVTWFTTNVLIQKIRRK